MRSGDSRERLYRGEYARWTIMIKRLTGGDMLTGPLGIRQREPVRSFAGNAASEGRATARSESRNIHALPFRTFPFRGAESVHGAEGVSV